MLAVLQIDEIWSVPFVTISHPYIERMIGTVRRELLDRTLFWNGRDLLKKLETYQPYFNQQRVHSGIGGKTPGRCAPNTNRAADPTSLQWKFFCEGLSNVPVAA